MTIASEITRIEGNISAAYTAADAKGATMPATENSDNLATCIASISGGGSTGKYALLDRVKDDSNNEIGTVSGFFTDANNVEYAVVCLDAQYRADSLKWISNESTVTNLPVYSNIYSSNVWGAKETATFNTQKILDYCSTQGYTSTACSHCRSQSFTIDGTTYYGQLPSVIEISNIAEHYSEIENKDASASTYPSTNFSSAHALLSSNQGNNNTVWSIGTSCKMTINSNYGSTFVAPVIEIPNAV